MAVRLAAEVWVAAYMRKVRVMGGSAYLRRRGADQGGAVILKITSTDRGFHEPNCSALTRVSTLEGGLAWSWLAGPELCAEAAVDAKLEKQTSFDPDLWIVEVEDRQGRHFLDDPIV